MTTVTADVCILGAGPVGLLAAHEALRSGASVLLAEADGPITPVHQTVGISSATRHKGIGDGRASGLGGTSQLWGGQLWTWEEAEFLARPELGLPEWPLDYSDLETRYSRVASVLQLTRGQIELLEGRSALDRPLNDQVRSRFSTWLPWRKRNVWRLLEPDLNKSPDFTLIAPATLETIERVNSSLRAIEARTPTHGMIRIEASTFLLAAGTVDNVRLVAANKLSDSPYLGYGFMDHLSGRALGVDVEDWHTFTDAAAPRLMEGRRFTPRYLPRHLPEAGGRFAFGHWEVERLEASPLSILRQKVREIQAGSISISPSDAIRLVTGSAELARMGIRAVASHRLAYPRGRVYLRVDVEQLPSSDGRLNVSPDGEVTLDWTVTDSDRSSFHDYAEFMLDSLPWSAFGCAKPKYLLEAPILEDTRHLMGGTRMSQSEADGVVDPFGRLHNLENVFVLGASTFPSAGVANPTLTACALASRTVQSALASRGS